MVASRSPGVDQDDQIRYADCAIAVEIRVALIAGIDEIRAKCKA